MERVAFTMKLYPGQQEEYKRRHAEIWPELSALLTETGITDYSIFLDEETYTLFAIYQLKPGCTTENLPQQEIMKKWWAYMQDIMETNPDHSPVSKPLTEVFHMD